MRQGEALPMVLKGYLTAAFSSIRILQDLIKGHHPDHKVQSHEEEWLSRKRTGNQTFFSLWPELSENPKKRKKQQQGDCYFLELPFEIREEIFRMAIGMELFHLVDMATRTGYIRCEGRQIVDESYWKQTSCSRHCASPLWSLVSYRSTPMFDRSSGFPALMLTCRQNYTQGVGILYSSNVFEAEYPETVVSLAECIRPSLLQSIRFLQVGGRARVLNFSTGIDKSWNEMWSVICHQMKSLRSLQVKLRIQLQDSRGHHDIWSDRAYTMLREWLEMPVENLRGLKHFNLILDTPAADDQLVSFQDNLETLICSSFPKGMPDQYPELFNSDVFYGPVYHHPAWGQV